MISIGRETVKQAVTACAPQVTLATAARAMCTVPGGRVCTATRAVVMAYSCAAVGSTIGPVPAGMVLTIRICSTVEIRSAQDIVAIRFVPAAIDDIAALTDRIVFTEVVFVAMQINDICRYLHPVRI